MFTGIIEAVGHISHIRRRVDDLVLSVNTGTLDLADVKLGDSIAVNGICLTVVSQSTDGFTADVSAETLVHSNVEHYAVGQRVNLEKALTLSSRLGGHLVSGHVDGTGTIVSRVNDGRSVRFELSCQETLLRYIAPKGSITIDGVSLTVTDVQEHGFCLNIVPHTAQMTIINDYRPGSSVHLEVDLMARYTERLIMASSVSEKASANSSIDHTFLAQHGFLK